MAARAQVFDELHRAALAVFFRDDAGAGVLVHRQGVHRNVGTRGGVGCGRQVVGVDFTGHLEDADGDALRHFRAAGEPLGIGPALQHALGVGVALVGLFLDVVELVEHQQGLLQAFGCHGADFGVVQQVDHGADVVAAEHGAEQFSGAGARDERVLLGAVGHGREVARLDLGGVVDAGGHTVGEQVQQEGAVLGVRALQELDRFGGLLRAQGQRRDTERGAFGNMINVGLQHLLFSGN
ncbi:hypothetical protein FQZ97_791730 [compost metagenome]